MAIHDPACASQDPRNWRTPEQRQCNCSEPPNFDKDRETTTAGPDPYYQAYFAGQVYYRQGQKQPQNVYYVTPEHSEGKYIGVFFDPDWARMAVTALNSHLEASNSHRAQEYQ